MARVWNKHKQTNTPLKRKVFVGLSGGVDSAVSAALLKNEGHDVVGAFITIQIPGYPCPAAVDRRDAMRVAAHLRIPFIEVDLSKVYETQVLAETLQAFARGETPNPDTLCNEKIKFGAFFDFCRAQGADYVATGHYARLQKSLREGEMNGSPTPSRRDFVSPAELWAGVDPEKDQSYFLWQVPETALRHTLFPVGDKTKKEVRALARRFGLPNAERPDSQGLCFLGPISMDDLLTEELNPEPGDVLDEAGAVVGLHRGVTLYTLGERHGFELFATDPETPPHFVIAKDVTRNTITVSASRFPQGATKTVVLLANTNWIGDGPAGAVQARFRYRQKLIGAELSFEDGHAVATLNQPHYMALGQSLVLYLPSVKTGQGNRCLGGGVIENATLK